MANNLTLSVTLTGDGRQLSGTLKDAQGDVREFSATTERESKKTETALTAPGRSAVTVSDHLRTTQREARAFGTEAAKGGREATQALSQTGRQAQTTTSHLNVLRTTVGLVAGAFSVRKIAGMVDGWSDMRSVVGASIGDMSAAGDMMRRITDIANASYAPLEQTARTYASNVSALRDLGRSAEETADYTESLNHHLVLTATRGQQAESVQNALSRAMAVGKLQADGLETVLANGGEVAQSLANQLGVTVSQLRGLASQGAITGDVIASALIGSLDDVRDRAGEMPATIEDGFVRIGTSATRLVGEVDQALGVSGGVAGILIGTADAISAIIDPLINNIDTLQSGITVVGAAAGAYVTYRSVLIAATAAQWAFNTAVRANPLGITITLLGAAAGALFAYREEVTLAGSESFQTSLDVDGLTSSFRLLTEAQQENKRASLVADLIDMRIEAGRLGSELVEVSRKVRESGQLTPEGGALPIATPEDIARGRELRQELGILLSDIGGGTKLLGEYDQAMEELGQTTSNTGTRTRALAETNTAATKAAAELANATAAQTKVLEDLYNRLIPGRRETVQLARDMQTLTLAIAMGTGNIGQNIQMMGLLQQQYIDAQKDTEDLADQTVKAAYTMEGAWDEVRLNGLRRLDDGFAELWESAIDGSMNAGELMKRALAQTLAEMAHMAITRPITVQLATSMGFGGGAAAGGTGGGFGISPGSIGNMWNAVQSGVGGIQWGGAGGAQAYGGGWANAATSGTGASGLWGGSMQNFQGMQGLAGLGAGFAGNWLGGELFGKGKHSNTLGTLGGLAGTYFGGPLGAFVGSGLGSALGGLFGGGKTNPHLNIDTRANASSYGHESVRSGAFGAVGFAQGTRRSNDLFGGIPEEREFLAAIAASDDLLASLARSPEELDRMANAVQGVRLSASNVESIMGQLSNRTIAAVKAIDGDFGAFVASLGTDVDTIIARTQNAMAAFSVLGAASENLNLHFNASANGALRAADNIAQFAGGVDQLNQLQNSYYQAFFTDAERATNLQRELTQAMGQMGYALPTTRDGFRALVEQQNQMTEAGQRQYVQLLQLAGGFDELQTMLARTQDTATDTSAALRSAAEIARERNSLELEILGLQGDTAEIRRRELEGIDESNRALKQRVWAIQDEQTAQREAERVQQDRIRAIENEAKAWSRAREQLASFSNSINGWLANLRGTQAGLASPGDQLAATSQAFYEQYDKALGGDRDALNSITQYADRFIEAQKGWSASGTQTTATIDKVAGMLGKLPEQLSAEQFLADDFRNSLDGQTAALQAALDLNGDGTISAIERAISSNWDTNDLLKGVLHQEMRRLGTTVLTEAQIRTALSPYATDAEISRLIGRVDINGDGFITQQELTNARIGGLSVGIAGSLAGHFKMLDANLDGKLTFAELKRGLTGIATDEELRLIMKAVDLNGDGVISQLESQTVAAFTQSDLLKSVLQSEMRRLGTDQLTAAQVRAALAPHATDDEISRLIKRVDTNGNGMINNQELTNARLGGLTSGFANAIANEFDRIDINASGLIDYNEFRRAFSGMATDSQLQRIFKTLDANGNGTISRLEAINASNNTISQLTGRVDGNTGRMDQKSRNSQEGMRVTLAHGQPTEVVRWMGEIFASRVNEWSSRIGAKHAQQFRNYGIGNGGKAYAQGGVFTNSIVSTPTYFNESLMGEAGPEAIVPLHMGPDGLGIKNYNDAPLSLSLPPLPSFPLLGNNDVVEAVRDLKREVTLLRKENAQLQRESNNHLVAANNQRGAAAKGQISAIERSNKMLKRMEDDKRLEATKR